MFKTLREVNKNAAGCTTMAGNIGMDIAEVSNATEEVSQVIGTLHTSAEEMGSLADQLGRVVARFKIA